MSTTTTTDTLAEARRAFRAARDDAEARGVFTDAARAKVEAIIGWNVDKLDHIEEAYAAKLERATKALP